MRIHYGTVGSSILDEFDSVPLEEELQDTFSTSIEQKFTEEVEPVPSDEDRDNVQGVNHWRNKKLTWSQTS